jgi:hypothetical protein
MQKSSYAEAHEEWRQAAIAKVAGEHKPPSVRRSDPGLAPSQKGRIVSYLSYLAQLQSVPSPEHHAKKTHPADGPPLMARPSPPW